MFCFVTYNAFCFVRIFSDEGCNKYTINDIPLCLWHAYLFAAHGTIRINWL